MAILPPLRVATSSEWGHGAAVDRLKNEGAVGGLTTSEHRKRNCTLHRCAGSVRKEPLADGSVLQIVSHSMDGLECVPREVLDSQDRQSTPQSRTGFRTVLQGWSVQ